MREPIREFVKICTETLRFPAPIYEFGAFQVPGQEAIADLRPLFPGREYVGADMREGRGVDRILNLHSLELPDESVGSALLIDTMEHVEYPHKAAEELHRVLKSDGIAIVTSVMKFPIHCHPCDFWRFTPEGMRSVLKEFAFLFVDYAGEDDFPHTVVAIASRREIRREEFETFESRFRTWKEWARPDSGREWLPHRIATELIPRGPAWRRALKIVLPPIVVDAYRLIRYGQTRGSP